MGFKEIMTLGTWLYGHSEDFDNKERSYDRLVIENMVQQLLQQNGIEFLKPDHLVRLPSTVSDCIEMLSGGRITTTNPGSMVRFFTEEE